MSDPVLKIIIRLCSLFSNIDDKTDQERTRELLKSYLGNYTKNEFIDQFLYVYDFYKNQQKIDKTKNFLKKASLRAVKAIRLVNNINTELLLREKFLLIILLLEIIRFKEKKLPEEYDFIETLAISFNLDEKEFYNLKNFILKSRDEIPWKENFIIINNNENPQDTVYKHIYRENLEGNICLLQIKSINAIWFYYDGDQQLFLNNKEIKPLRIYAFQKGNSISSYKVGFQNLKLKPIYYTEIGIKLTDNPDFKKITFEISDVEFKYPDSPNGIKKFSFKSESHLLVGIIGPSGSGKSTLLNLLNGTLTPNSGQVLINGINLHEENEKVKGVIGFVPQDDLLFEELSVYENLYFNAKLCFSDYNEEQINETVNRVLNDLDLTDIKDLKVGSTINKVISGGQRKRLNIGMELMREPAILFVDEPTSGLSSNDSLNLVNTLREQTLRGKLVIINIHQPSSDIYKIIDQLIVLDDNGHVVYTGDPLDAVVYFRTLSNQINPSEKECSSCGNVNPEIILEIIEEKTINENGRYTDKRKVPAEEWYKIFNENKREEIKIFETSKELPQVHFKIPNRIKQFVIFSKRNLLSKLANRQYLLIALIEAPLLATILGFFTKYNIGTAENPNAYIFSENLNIPAYILMSIIVSLFIGLLISAEEIIKDQKILIREKFLNLSRFSYINSKVVFLFTLTTIQSISYVLIGNFILEIKGLTFHYWLILFSTGCFANMLGLLISANLKSVIAIYILIPFLIIPQLLLSGTIVKFDKLHSSLTTKEYPPIIADLMPSRWAYEALAVSHFVDNKFEQNYYNIDKLNSDISYKLNFLIPKINSLIDEWRTILITNNNNERIQEISEIISITTRKYMSDIPNVNVRIIGIDNLPANQRINKYQNFLDFARLFYSEYLDQVLYKKDIITNNLVDKLNGPEGYIKYKNCNYNEAIANMVLRMDDHEKYFIKDNVILRRYEPIFITPSNSFGRAQFYSAHKKLGSSYLASLYFNSIAIWLISLVIYIILIFDLINKLKFNKLKQHIKIFKKNNNQKLKTINQINMKKQSVLTIGIVAFFFIATIFSCKSGVKKDTSENIDTQAISDSLLKSEENLIFYSFPSSQEMFSFIKKDAELVYRTDLVNSLDNSSKYIDSKSKTLALGVYLADLSYMTLFNKTSNAYEYIDIITTLSNDLRINLPFKDEFLQRIKDNLDDEDSLIYISDQYSTMIVDYLLQNNKEKVLANITSASYIEGLYLALNLVENYSENNAVIQRIVEQKHSFTNLIKYANKYKADVNTQEAIVLLQSIYTVFEKFEETEEKESTLERGDDNKMILKGGSQIIISEAEFNELKAKVFEVRTKIVENNF